MTSSHTPPPGHIPPEQSLIEYPGDFPIKVMELMHDDFTTTIVEVVRLYDPEFHEGCLGKRSSSSGNYLGPTVIACATSRGQPDMLYQASTSHPMVKIVL